MKLVSLAMITLFAALGPSTAVSAAEPELYSSLLVRALKKAHRYPVDGLRRTGTASVAFEIDRVGKVLQSKIKESSGDATLDRAAIETIERAQPLPVPPPSIADDDLHFTVPIVFGLSKQYLETNKNVQLEAYLAGNCSSPLGETEVGCKYARFWLKKDGKATFTFNLTAPNDTVRSVSFFGSSGRNINGLDYELDVETLSVFPPVSQNSEPAQKATGSCKQNGDFSKREFSTLTCNATTGDGKAYSVELKSDGSLIKARTYLDERLLTAK